VWWRGLPGAGHTVRAHAQHPARCGSILPGFSGGQRWAGLTLLIRPSLRAPAWVVLSHLLWANTGLVSRSTAVAAQRLEATTLAQSRLLFDCRPVGGGPCRACGSLARHIYAFTATSVLRVQRAWGCGPVGANPQRIKNDAWGDGAPGQ